RVLHQSGLQSRNRGRLRLQRHRGHRARPPDHQDPRLRVLVRLPGPALLTAPSRRNGRRAGGGNMTGYLPGDPRYGLSGEALRNYYRTKLAQWAIYCWDKPGTAETRRGLVADQKSYVKSFGERVIGYGHFVSDDGRDTLGTAFFMPLHRPAAAGAFVTAEP